MQPVDGCLVGCVSCAGYPEPVCVCSISKSNKPYPAAALRNAETGCFQRKHSDAVFPGQRIVNCFLKILAEFFRGQPGDIFRYEDEWFNGLNSSDQLGKHIADVVLSGLITRVAEWLAWRPSVQYIHRSLVSLPVHVADVTVHASVNSPLLFRGAQYGGRVLPDFVAGYVVESSPFESDVQSSASGEQAENPERIRWPNGH